MLRSWGGGRKETPTLEMAKHRATEKPMDFVLKDMICHIEIRSFNFLIPPIPENSQINQTTSFDFTSRDYSHCEEPESVLFTRILVQENTGVLGKNS